MRLIDLDELLKREEQAYRQVITQEAKTPAAPILMTLIHEAFVEMLTDSPIVEAEPVRHGRWNFTSCSLCGKSFLDYAEADCDRSIYLDLPNYCPNCGAKMDKEETT